MNTTSKKATHGRMCKCVNYDNLYNTAICIFLLVHESKTHDVHNVVITETNRIHVHTSQHLVRARVPTYAIRKCVNGVTKTKSVEGG